MSRDILRRKFVIFLEQSFVEIYRDLLKSSHQRCSTKVSVRKQFRKIYRKTLCQSLFFNKFSDFWPTTLLKRDSGTGAFLWVLQNFQKRFLTEHLWTTPSVYRREEAISDISDAMTKTRKPTRGMIFRIFMLLLSKNIV